MFNIDSGFWGFVSKLTDLVVLNILFLICCIPIITIGASVTALYGVLQKMTDNKEGYIVRSFLKLFKENFRKSTIMWLILFIILIITSVDIYIVNSILEGMLKYMFNGFMVLAIIIVIFVMQYALTLQCTFENTINNTMKNALFMSIGHLPWTFIITILTLSPFLAVAFLTKFIGVEIFLMLLIWFSGVAYINSFIFNKIYRKYMPEE